MLSFPPNFIAVTAEKQCVLVPGPCPLHLLTWFEQQGLLDQFYSCLVMVPEGRQSLVFLEGVSVAKQCGKNPQSFCLCFSVRQFRCLCALDFRQWDIGAVPRAFSSLGVPTQSCPVVWTSSCFLFEGFQCLINAKMKHVLLDSWRLNQMSSLHYLQKWQPLSGTWGP